MPKDNKKSKTARDFPSNFTVTPVKPLKIPEAEGAKESQSSNQARAVLRKENFWRTVAQWSAIIFFLAAGVGLLGYYYWSGEDSKGPWAWLAGGDRIELPAKTTLESGPVEISDEIPLRIVDGRTPLKEVSSGIYYAVMIDNHFDARPLSGLAEAPLVYEVPVEGGITRFMVIYSADDLVKRIGPVRSARPYYLDWASEFDSFYVHVGGSPEALSLIKQNESIRDLNEFWNGKYFWRDLSRQAPYKIFTSSALLGNAFSDKFGEEEIFPVDSWLFKEDLALEDRPFEVIDVEIDWSSPIHQVAWHYDREDNHYERLQAGQVQRDEDNSTIQAKNVILQFSTIKVIDQIGRRRIDTISSGRAVILNDGQVIEATWNKSSADERIEYLTSDGDEVFFNVGNTWVEVIPAAMDIIGLD